MMKQRLLIWKRRSRYVLFWVVVQVVCSICSPCNAKTLDLPNYVKIVKNEKAMIRHMMKEMKKHKTQFAFYYPGIEQEFRKYRKESKGFATFFEKIAKKDGYRMGIVSGYCITICGKDTRYVMIQLSYLTTKKQEKQINKKVKQIVKRVGKGSRFSKVKKAHDYLIVHMQYDERYYNPYYAFSKGKGICMSYALAYQRILQEMNIPCIYVKGKDHAWNMVKLGKYWYNVDVTWDDTVMGKYRYFLKSDEDFPGHKRPKSRLLSSLRKAKKSYYLKY